MKSIVIIFLTLFVFSVNLRAQLYSVWGYEDPSFVQFVDEQNGWTGDCNRVLHTVDGGKTWEVQLNFESDASNYGGDYKILGAHFTNVNNGLLNVRDGDYKSYILKTNDGGNSWERYLINNDEIPIGFNLSDVNIVDDLNCFALYGTQKVLASYDGGKSWSVVFDNGQSIYDLTFANSQIGYARFGWDKFMKTTDGGVTWNEIDFSGTQTFLNIAARGSKVWTTDQWTGLYFSEDYGETWSLISNESYSKLTMIDDNFGIADDKFVTFDGGVTWTEKLNSLATSFLDVNHGWIIAPDQGVYARKHIQKVTNEFQNFEIKTPSNEYNDIVTVGENIIIAVTENGEVLRSTDKGKTWKLNRAFPSQAIFDICFNNDTDGVLVGASWNYTFIANSTDAGETWAVVFSDSTDNWLTAIDYVDGSFKVVNPYRVLVSGDNGNSWSEQGNVTGLPPAPVQKIDFIDSDTGFANCWCNDGNYLYKTTDGGQTWSASYEEGINDFAFSSENIGWCARSANYGMAKTLDQGNTWNEVQNGATRIYFKDSFLGIFIGALDYTDFSAGYGVFLTRDGGATWEKISGISSFSSELHSGIDFTSEELGVFASADKIYSTLQFGDITDVIIDVENNNELIPKDYLLSQNYPNPFNPSTVINFQIPESGFVTLKVYDILGKEVATLVNEIQLAGNHKVTFDAAKLPSGIYFYTMKAGKFNQTKKMILIK